MTPPAGPRGTADDNIITIRDIYTLVQQLNTQVTGLVQQVNTLSERAAEDRREAEGMYQEMSRLKVKVYAVITAITLASTALVGVAQFTGQK